MESRRVGLRHGKIYGFTVICILDLCLSARPVAVIFILRKVLSRGKTLAAEACLIPKAFNLGEIEGVFHDRSAKETPVSLS